MVYDEKSTENITKGIIVAYSRSGITIQQIADVFWQCTEEQWPLLEKGESHAIQYLEQIDGVLSIVNEKNQLLWYVRGKILNGENRGRIYRSNVQQKSTNFGITTNAYGNIPNTCFQHANNKTNGTTNNHNSRNGRSNKMNVDHNSNNNCNRVNGNHEPQNNVQQKFYTNDRMRGNRHSYGNCNNNDIIGGSINGRRTLAHLNNYDLIGDDFFMELAKIDLSCSYTSRRSIQKSGLCISGQTIRDATDRIKRISNPNNMKIIVNLGTVDILQVHDLTDICNDYSNLINLCIRRNITLICTTLATSLRF